MKQKLLNALKQGFKNLGVSEEAFERVASFGQTFITSDEQIANFVKGAESLLKAEQSAADKVRTELNGRIKAIEGENADLKAKLNGNNPPKPEEAPAPNPAPVMTPEQLEALIAKANAPLLEKISALEAASAKKSAVETLDAYRSSWDYAKGYPNEAADAYESAMELYEATGSKWGADELKNKFVEKFNKAVQRKGVDTSKPFEADKKIPGKESNEEFAAKIRASLGIKEEGK